MDICADAVLKNSANGCAAADYLTWKIGEVYTDGGVEACNEICQ